jgi:hypothetical protein
MPRIPYPLAELQRSLPARQVIEVIMTAGSYRMLCMLLETGGVEIETPDSDAPRLTQAEWRQRLQPQHD